MSVCFWGNVMECLAKSRGLFNFYEEIFVIPEMTYGMRGNYIFRFLSLLF